MTFKKKKKTENTLSKNELFYKKKIIVKKIRFEKVVLRKKM